MDIHLRRSRHQRYDAYKHTGRKKERKHTMQPRTVLTYALPSFGRDSSTGACACPAQLPSPHPPSASIERTGGTGLASSEMHLSFSFSVHINIASPTVSIPTLPARPDICKNLPPQMKSRAMYGALIITRLAGRFTPAASVVVATRTEMTRSLKAASTSDLSSLERPCNPPVSTVDCQGECSARARCAWDAAHPMVKCDTSTYHGLEAACDKCTRCLEIINLGRYITQI